jgi:predicted alpha/beta superfamily hydrolase
VSRREWRGRRYPVVYLLDSQNLFGARLSAVSHRECGVDEASTG